MDASHETGPDPTSLVGWWLEAMDTGDTSAAERIMSDAFLEHAAAPFAHEAPGSVAGPAHLRGTVAWLRGQFPDLRMTARAIVAQGDLVAVLVSSTGTDRGGLGALHPPTGRAFDAAQTHWFRIRDGRISEHWATRDDLTVMLQLGVVQGPGDPAVTAGRAG